MTDSVAEIARATAARLPACATPSQVRGAVADAIRRGIAADRARRTDPDRVSRAWVRGFLIGMAGAIAGISTGIVLGTWMAR